MMHFPIFLSVVMGVRNRGEELESLLREIGAVIAPLVDDYELIVVENGSTDGSVATLSALTLETGLPNLQVYALAKPVDSDTVAWAGFENALGDFVAVVDPYVDDITFLATMLRSTSEGIDIVYASNTRKRPQSFAYRACRAAFYAVYKSLNGVQVAKQGSQYRLLSKRVVNFVLKHPLPALAYRRLPATGGFQRADLTYHSVPRSTQRKWLAQAVDQSLRLLVSTNRLPMRFVTAVFCLASFSSLATASFVLIRSMGRPNGARGAAFARWQQSGLLCLGSVVQFIFGEYMLQMTSVSSEGPPYHVAEEFTSAIITRRAKLNIEASRARAQAVILDG